MQTVIEAKSEDEAKYLVMGKIIFHEVKDETDPVDTILGFFNKKR